MAPTRHAGVQRPVQTVGRLAGGFPQSILGTLTQRPASREGPQSPSTVHEPASKELLSGTRELLSGTQGGQHGQGGLSFRAGLFSCAPCRPRTNRPTSKTALLDLKSPAGRVSLLPDATVGLSVTEENNGVVSRHLAVVCAVGSRGDRAGNRFKPPGQLSQRGRLPARRRPGKNVQGGRCSGRMAGCLSTETGSVGLPSRCNRCSETAGCGCSGSGRARGTTG